MPMRTAPERLLVRLEWRVVRRLDGRMAGGYRTAHRGTGTDLVGLREYTEGDDARHIDWNVTARLNEPQLRVFIEDRELTVWLVLDRSASMTVGTPGRGKDERAQRACPGARPAVRPGREPRRRAAIRHRSSAYRAAGHRAQARAAHRRRARQDRRRWPPPVLAGTVLASTGARPTSRRCSTRSPSSPGAAP